MGDIGHQVPPGPQPQEQPEQSVYVPSVIDGRLWQGELFSDLVQVRLALQSLQRGSEQVNDYVEHPHAVVLSQDCDLVQDYELRRRGDGNLPNVLFCDIHEAANYQATLQQREDFGRRDWRRIEQNQNERYHFLQRVNPDEDALQTGLPMLVIDFKMYFTIPTDEVYARLLLNTRRRCRLNTPYVEHLGHRFSSFQSRVALPVDHLTEP